MNVWMELKRALTVMDHVTRNWGRELQLDECAVMVLALLGEGGPSPLWSLAAKCGRARPQVHRALRVLADRDYAAPLVLSGRARSWELTDRGRELWRCLNRGIGEFEAELQARIDLATLKTEFQRIVQILLNRPRANGGWRFGLYVPIELLKLPLRTEASVEGLLGRKEKEAEAGVPIETEAEWLPPSPGLWGPPEEWTPAEREFLAFCRELERAKEKDNNKPQSAAVGPDS
jgi:DNA-binding MarR family transcriptional regulator